MHVMHSVHADASHLYVHVYILPSLPVISIDIHACDALSARRCKSSVCACIYTTFLVPSFLALRLSAGSYLESAIVACGVRSLTFGSGAIG